MAKKNHLQDAHIMGSHPTTAECGSEVVEALRRYNSKLDIKPGIIRVGASRGGTSDLKVWEQEGGLKIRVRGHGCIQFLWVYNVPDHASREVLVGVLIERFGPENVHWFTKDIIYLASLGLART